MMEPDAADRPGRCGGRRPACQDRFRRSGRQLDAAEVDVAMPARPAGGPRSPSGRRPAARHGRRRRGRPTPSCRSVQARRSGSAPPRDPASRRSATPWTRLRQPAPVERRRRRRARRRRATRTSHPARRRRQASTRLLSGARTDAHDPLARAAGPAAVEAARARVEVQATTDRAGGPAAAQASIRGGEGRGRQRRSPPTPRCFADAGAAIHVGIDGRLRRRRSAAVGFAVRRRRTARRAARAAAVSRPRTSIAAYSITVL